MSPPDPHRLPVSLIEACGARIHRLNGLLTQQAVDALVVTCEKDIQYLTGFVGHDSLLLLCESDAIIISDPRYDEYLDPWRNAKTVEVVMGKRHRLTDSVLALSRRLNIRRLGIQAEHVTVARRAKFAQVLGEITLVDTHDILPHLRRVKDSLEIAAIEQAIGIQEDALQAALEQLTIGTTELQFSALLEFEMKMRGSQGAGFTPIIGAGPNSSIIHHSTGSTSIHPGVLLVDWGASIDGYNGDLTRTFALGEMPAKIREIYPIVLEAQLAAIDAIAPGRICAEIDAIARNVITKAGFGEYFGHGLGHGLGMDVHESPYFNDLETAVKLEPGMIMTVEPGIYLPGIGGVRIEDDVLVAGSSHRVLSDFPKDLPSTLIDLAPIANANSHQRR